MKTKYIVWGVCGAGVLTAVIALIVSRNKKENYSQDIYNPQYDKYLGNVDKNSEYGQSIREFANNRPLVSEYAQKLHDAMKNAGTEFGKILEVVSALDEPQMRVVADRFGKRAYYNRLWGIPTASGKMLNLKEWFKEELSDSEYQQIRDKYPNLF